MWPPVDLRNTHTHTPTGKILLAVSIGEGVRGSDEEPLGKIKEK